MRNISENQFVIDELKAAVRELEVDAKRINNPWQQTLEEKFDAYKEMGRLEHALLYVHSLELETRLTQAKRKYKDCLKKLNRIEAQSEPLLAAIRQLRKETKKRTRIEWWRNFRKTFLYWVANPTKLANQI